MNIRKLKTTKENALNLYKLAKAEYLANRTDENWKKFCDAKIVCMRLGCRI